MHLSGAWILIIFITVAVLVTLLVLHFTRIGGLLHESIQQRSRRRFFLASVSFFGTFLAVRLLVFSIRHHFGPFQYVVIGGEHIHHLVWGILILLGVGYGWLFDFGNGATVSDQVAARLMSLLYGVGAALTLDEFALWLTLNGDAYWTRQGRDSIDAVILFGALLSIGGWGLPFFTAAAQRLGWPGKSTR